jgi:HEAT repeat protein
MGATRTWAACLAGEKLKTESVSCSSTSVPCPDWNPLVCDAQRYIEAFEAHAMSSVRAKLDALLALERLHDPRVVPFFIQVLANRGEPTPVRIRVLKRLRNGNPIPEYRSEIAAAMVDVLADRSCPDLRMQAALALAVFADTDAVALALGGIALDSDEPIDLRYSAFTSLQRAGPTPECVDLFRQLSADEALGRSARSVLSSWRVE